MAILLDPPCPRATVQVAPVAAARERWDCEERRAWFQAGWMRALMLHYALPPEVLAPMVPFALDLRGGSAWVSLVFFTQERLRPALRAEWAQHCAEVFSAPLARHGFLNVRTYVRVNGEPGIYFLSEHIPNPLAVLLGPALYGLPYRLGRLAEACAPEAGRMRRSLDAGWGTRRVRVAVTASWNPRAVPMPSAAGSLAEFLMERYTAYTLRRGVRRRFRIWHDPWPQVPAQVGFEHAPGRLCAPWFAAARFAGANYSPGVPEVLIGRPVVLTAVAPTS